MPVAPRPARPRTVAQPVQALLGDPAPPLANLVRRQADPLSDLLVAHPLVGKQRHPGSCHQPLLTGRSTHDPAQLSPLLTAQNQTCRLPRHNRPHPDRAEGAAVRRVHRTGGFEAVGGYARAVRTNDTIAVSGTAATGPDGAALHPGDVRAQTAEAIDRGLAGGRRARRQPRPTSSARASTSRPGRTGEPPSRLTTNGSPRSRRRTRPCSSPASFRRACWSRSSSTPLSRPPTTTERRTPAHGLTER